MLQWYIQTFGLGTRMINFIQLFIVHLRCNLYTQTSYSPTNCTIPEYKRTPACFSNNP